MSVLNFSYNFNPRSYKRSDISIISVDIYPQISIHAPTRGATRKIVRGYYTIQFQSTLLQEERLDGLEKALTIAISIHAPTRGATEGKKRINRGLRFQSTLLQEERRIIFTEKLINWLFQSTLLQEERRSPE